MWCHCKVMMLWMWCLQKEVLLEYGSVPGVYVICPKMLTIKKSEHFCKIGWNIYNRKENEEIHHWALLLTLAIVVHLINIAEVSWRTYIIDFIWFLYYLSAVSNNLSGLKVFSVSIYKHLPSPPPTSIGN